MDPDPDPNWAKILDPDPNSMYLDPQHCSYVLLERLRLHLLNTGTVTLPFKIGQMFNINQHF